MSNDKQYIEKIAGKELGMIYHGEIVYKFRVEDNNK
ncbi:septum formation initiator family protein [bacterium]